MSDLIRRIAEDLVLPIDAVRHTILYAPLRYRRFTIPKRSGGHRVIIQPAVKLKPILSWINTNLLSKLPIHQIAAAFRPGKSILDNALAHSGFNYSVRVDISGFFPAINCIDLVQAINDSKEFLPQWAHDPVALDMVTKICFDRDGKLPIGYSTSPAIANAVMYRIDSELAELISREALFGKATVTRYADDFVFSSDRKGACNSFVEKFASILAANKHPALSINPEKTKYMSRAGGSTLVTGLRVNNLGNVVVHANYRDHVRLLLKLHKKKVLRADEHPKLVGHLAYIQHVDPAFFTKLSFKYYLEIAQLRGGSDSLP